LTNRPCLNLNLSRKTDSTIAYNNLDQLLRQAASPNEISALLSSLESSKSIDELQKSSLNEKNCDYCCCDLFSESNSSNSNDCITCMSLPNTTTITCAFNPRYVEMKERLKLKLTKRTVQNTCDQSKSSSSIGNKYKSKPCDNNIDDLVRFIDGNESNTNEITSKKKKNKKNKSTSKNPIVDPPIQTLSKQKKKTKLKIEQQENQIDEPSSIKPPTPSPPPPPPPLPEKTDSNRINTEPSSENPISPEEEVNWITISRKQSKHKPTSVPSLLAVPVIPSNNTKQKRQQTTIKTKISNTQTIAQQKVIPETVSNSNKQHTTMSVAPSRVQNSVKTQNSQQQKIETPSAWTTHEQPQGINIFLIVFHRTTNVCFFLFSGTIIDSSCNNTSFCSI
jgi:hypothetical protein